MKQNMLGIVSNSALCENLIHHIRTSTLNHAYIIEGKSGSGKMTLAKNIAAALSCKEKDNLDSPLPCYICSACKKIMSVKSPDVIIIDRDERASVSVEMIRNLRNDAAIYPNELDYKIYIIKDADLMTIEAQNALLLTLEEPPKYVIIVLLCEDSSQFLETIRSRAPVIHTLPVSVDDIDEYLINGCGGDTKTSNAAKLLKNNNLDEYRELLLAADGCIGQAIILLDNKQRIPIMKSRELIKKLTEAAALSQSVAQTFELLNELPQKRAELCSCIILWENAIRDLLVCKKSDYSSLCFFSSQEQTMALSENFTEKHLYQIYNACENTLSALDANANIKLTLTKLFIQTGLY